MASDDEGQILMTNLLPCVNESMTPKIAQDDMPVFENLRIEQDHMDRELGDDEPSAHRRAKTTSEPARRRAKHHALLEARKIAVVESNTTEALRNETSSGLTLRAIIARQQSRHIISSPREYQMELFHRAKDQNTIAVLDTGSGKTLIAVLLLKHTIDIELESRARGNTPRVSFFLTNTVALAFQQNRVLQSNIDQPVALVVGNMLPELWPKDSWMKLLQANKIIVCTPEILLHCLFRSFVKVEDINLLIFDEAHHAKKNHAYAKIVKDFYMCQQDQQKRPRIFGMTASPVDVSAGKDLVQRARELETLLHATIATISDFSMLHPYAPRPKTIMHFYDRQKDLGKSQLYLALKHKLNECQGLEILFERADSINRGLGEWCSDMYWTLAFSERALRKREDQLLRSTRTLSSSSEIHILDEKIADVKAAQELVGTTRSLQSRPDLLDIRLSPKVRKLFQLLSEELRKNPKSKCLVFVEKKDTARLLSIVADNLNLNGLKSAMITGVSSDQVNVATNSIRDQALTMLKFRNDELNCLFATSVAEEGIDVPNCNLVVRFDPCKTLIQYIQSRGRARHKSSQFFHLIEKGNVNEEMSLDEILEAETKLDELCRALPEDRKIDSEPESLEERSQRTYIEALTGAKLTYDYSQVVLNNFIGCIPQDLEDDTGAIYEITSVARKFVCQVLLPKKSPISSATGLPYSTKANARRSAAFEACLKLRRGDYLDENFLPRYAKKYPSLANARLSLSLKAATQYNVQTKPSMWQHGYGELPDRLFLTTLHLKQAWNRPVRAIGILTRIKLPSLPSFPIYRVDGQICEVMAQCNVTMVEGSPKIIEQLTWFTLTVFKDLFNKTFEDDPLHFPYWLVPLSLPITELSSTYPLSDLIDWVLLTDINQEESVPWTIETENESLLNKFLIDPWHGGRRFFTKRIAPEFLPTDPEPPHVVGSQKKESIMEYSISSLFKQSAAKYAWSENQQVILAERAMHRLHVLRPPDDEERNVTTECYICPQPFRISQIPCDVVSACLLFPAIIHRLESYLIAIEYFESIGLQVEANLALEAITKSSNDLSNTNDDQISHMRGMGPDYERLEFIGDTFLKMATSISVFVGVAEDEFVMHVRRMKMLCNKTLFETASRHGWHKFIRCEPFSRRKWYPPNIKLLEGKGAKTQEQQAPLYCSIGDKTIADVCEATIGAALLTSLGDGFSHNAQYDSAVKAVSLVVENEDHKMNQWSDYYESYKLPNYWTGQATASQRDLVEKLKERMLYVFHNPRVARSAFTHPSQPDGIERLPSYQRLEFLGDALLDMAAVDFLFRQFPDKDPHWLTEHKPIIVSNRLLGVVSVRMGFHKHLRYAQNDMAGDIRRFVEDIEAAQVDSEGSMNYWTRVKEGPKCLADIVESYIGAMFVDSKFDYAVVQRFFDENIKIFFEDFNIYQDFVNNNAMTKLHQTIRNQLGCRFYSIIASEMENVDALSSQILAVVAIHDEVISQRFGSSTESAKTKAVEEALKIVENESPSSFRKRYNCDCNISEDSETTN